MWASVVRAALTKVPAIYFLPLGGRCHLRCTVQYQYWLYVGDRYSKSPEREVSGMCGSESQGLRLDVSV